MNRYENLIYKLDNNQQLNLLFISPDYKGTYPFSFVETSYFNKERFDCTVKLITSDDINEVVKLADSYDCIVNLCDGYLNNVNKTPHTDIIDALEENNIPYTGANRRVYCLSKTDLIGKINTPNSLHYKDYIMNNLLIEKLSFPLFVKPDNLGCSELIDENSVVYNVDELNIQLNKIIDKTDNIVIQEYIKGNEYTALIFRKKNGDILCLDPIEIKFTNTLPYLTHNIKVNEFDKIIYEFDIDEKIKSKIKEICVDAYEKLNINSYVRLDLRENYIIDVNSYPEILGLVEEENIGDTIIQKFYNFDDFLTDILYDACRKKI